jgi:hypothetical protein
VSFDVVGLYPNVSIEESLRSIKTWLSTEIQDLEKFEIYYEAVETCTNHRFFQFRDNVFKQNFGTSMGNLLSPFAANFFMADFEQKIEKDTRFPKFWCRYVDDIFAVCKSFPKSMTS